MIRNQKERYMISVTKGMTYLYYHIDFQEEAR